MKSFGKSSGRKLFRNNALQALSLLSAIAALTLTPANLKAYAIAAPASEAAATNTTTLATTEAPFIQASNGQPLTEAAAPQTNSIDQTTQASQATYFTPPSSSDPNLANTAPAPLSQTSALESQPLKDVLKSSGSPTAPGNEDNLNHLLRTGLSLVGVLGLFWLVAQKWLRPIAATRANASGQGQSLGQPQAQTTPPARSWSKPFWMPEPSAAQTQEPSLIPIQPHLPVPNNATGQRIRPDNALMKVLSQQELGAGRTLYLVQVKNRLLVVAGTGQMMTLLSEFALDENLEAATNPVHDATSEDAYPDYVPENPYPGQAAKGKAPLAALAASTRPHPTAAPTTRKAKAATKFSSGKPLPPKVLLPGHHHDAELYADYQEVF
ncbi:MAG: flagellar biosynthetic protein FliO [Vampirovibrionales bacterium]|nr:flagellar biosynthetic protein FliO [Vampirovibrionales bacterium]